MPYGTNRSGMGNFIFMKQTPKESNYKPNQVAKLSWKQTYIEMSDDKEDQCARESL